MAGVNEAEIIQMQITETAHKTGIQGITIEDFRKSAVHIHPNFNRISENPRDLIFALSLTDVLSYEPQFGKVAMVRPYWQGVTTVTPVIVNESDLDEKYVKCGKDDLVFKLDIQPALITAPSGEKKASYIARTFVEELQEVAAYVQDHGDPQTTVIMALTHKAVIDVLAKELPSQFAAAHVNELDYENLDADFVRHSQELIARSIDYSKVRRGGKQTDPVKVRPYIIAIRVSDFLAAA